MIGRYDIWEKPNICNKSNISSTIHTGLNNFYISLWSTTINTSQPKLRTYCRFKTDFALENYIQLFKRSTRLNFTKLRISAHTLMVEKGRHFSPKLPLSERICQLCNLHEVEDEFHFVMKCTKYNFQRDRLFKELSEIYNLDSLSNEDISLHIMCTTVHDVLKSVFTFINSCFIARNCRNTSLVPVK